MFEFFDKNRMKLCAFSSVILGLIAHAFRYFNLQFSSDTLNRIFIDEDIIIGKLEQGRFTNHVLMALRHLYYAPWLIGIISLLLVALSAYLVTDLFEIDNNISICLIAGLMAVNHTLTIINASFSYVADVYMWTILMFVLAAYIIIKYSRWFHIVIAGILISVGIAAYQSYVPIVPSIVLIWVIIRSFEDSDIKTSIIKIVNTIISVAIAGALYVLGLAVFVKGQGLEFVGRFDAVKPADGNVLINLVKVIVDSYIYVAKFFLQRTFYNNNLLRSINALLILFVGFVVIYLLTKLKISVKNKVIILVSCALFPLVMNSVFVVFNGRMMHHLMTYHFMIAYVLVIVLLDYMNKKQVLSDKTVSYMNKIIYIGIMLIIYLSILFANDIYLKKNLEYDDTLLVFNRIISRVEMLDGYHVDKDNEIVFIGDLSQSELGQQRYGFEPLYDDLSMSSSFATTTYIKYKGVIEYVMNYPITVVDKSVADEYSDLQEVKDMPCFPENGSVQFVDGKIVVKITE